MLHPFFPTPADLYSEEPGEEEPAWVQTEREQFRDFRDLNKDGRLDGNEVGHWVLPPAQDQPLVEANHLLHESDLDKVPWRGCASRRWGKDASLFMTKSWAWSCWGPCLAGERNRDTGRGAREGRNQRPKGGREGPIGKGTDLEGHTLVQRGLSHAGPCDIPTDL